MWGKTQKHVRAEWLPSGVQVGAQRNCGSDAGAREGFSEEEPFDLELERWLKSDWWEEVFGAGVARKNVEDHMVSLRSWTGGQGELTDLQAGLWH